MARIRKKGGKKGDSIEAVKGSKKTIDWLYSAADDDGNPMLDEDGDEEYALYIDLNDVLYGKYRGDVDALLGYLKKETNMEHQEHVFAFSMFTIQVCD